MAGVSRSITIRLSGVLSSMAYHVLNNQVAAEDVPQDVVFR
jgi:hypothetical protein